jgi:hypothetical protein
LDQDAQYIVGQQQRAHGPMRNRDSEYPGSRLDIAFFTFLYWRELRQRNRPALAEAVAPTAD